MKRIIALLFIIIMTLSFASCFERDLPDFQDVVIKPDVTEPNIEAEPEVTPTPEPEAEPEVTPIPEPEAEPEVTPTPEPEAEPEVTPTPEPEAEPEVTPTPEPEAEPEVIPTPEPDVQVIVPEENITPDVAMTYLGADLVRGLYNGKDNLFVSPVSVSMALGLTAGGAGGETFTQLEKAIGRGVPMADTVSYLEKLSDKLDDAEGVDMDIANSLWIKDDESAISVKKSYLEYADEHFDAEVFREAFDTKTVDKINSWVRDETDGMIKKLIDSINRDTVMYIINALSFDAEWYDAYDDTSDRFIFTNFEGDAEKVTGMYSTEGRYLEDDTTIGFVKNYKGGDYGFALLLPKENVTIDDYVKELTGDKLISILNNSTLETVRTAMPKFSFEYSAELNDVLKAMGVTDAFDKDKADFSELGTTERENIFVSKVIHKTFIEVAEKGTKAAAVTSVVLEAPTSAAEPEEIKRVIANRPFVFAIIDNNSRLPIFMGAVLSVE